MRLESFYFRLLPLAVNSTGCIRERCKLNFILAPTHKVVSQVLNARASLLRNDKCDKKNPKTPQFELSKLAGEGGGKQDFQS